MLRYVRELTEDDAAILLPLAQQSDFKSITMMLDSPGYAWGLFESEGNNDKLIGFCSIGGADADEDLAQYPEYTSDSLLLCDVFIDEAYRGKGLGAFMVQRAIRYQDCSESVFCTVLDDNLRYFYQKIGFKWKGDGVLVYTQHDFFPCEHKPGAEAVHPEGQCCPMCGAVPYLRQIACFDKPIIIACDCGFYQASTTRRKAFNLWNKATDITLHTKLKREDASPSRKIIDTIGVANSVCQNCQFRKEKYEKVPQICKECGFLEHRNASYQSEVWVYEE